MPEVREDAPSDELLDRLRSIDWAANAGSSRCLDTLELEYPWKRVKNLKTAKKQVQSLQWENIRLEASNEKTEYLHDNFRREYQRWNVSVDRMCAFLLKDLPSSVRRNARTAGVDLDSIETDLFEVIPVLGTALGLSSEKSVQVFLRDLTALAAEELFGDFELPNSFAFQLLQVYEQGHIPVGWEGAISDWPEGTLLIY